MAHLGQLALAAQWSLPGTLSRIAILKVLRAQLSALLLENAEDCPSDSERAVLAAISNAAPCEDADLVPMLKALAKSPIPNRRQSAIRALKHCSDADADVWTMLTSALHDNALVVQTEAVMALGLQALRKDVHGEQARKHLVSHILDNEEGMHETVSREVWRSLAPHPQELVHALVLRKYKTTTARNIMGRMTKLDFVMRLPGTATETKFGHPDVGYFYFQAEINNNVKVSLGQLEGDVKLNIYNHYTAGVRLTALKLNNQPWDVPVVRADAQFVTDGHYKTDRSKVDSLNEGYTGSSRLAAYESEEALRYRMAGDHAGRIAVISARVSTSYIPKMIAWQAFANTSAKILQYMPEFALSVYGGSPHNLESRIANVEANLATLWKNTNIFRAHVNQRDQLYTDIVRDIGRFTYTMDWGNKIFTKSNG